MRCINCGWDNKTDANSCIKCGQPLKDYDSANENKPVIQKRNIGHIEPKLTIRGTASISDNRKTTLFQQDYENEDTSQLSIQGLSECSGCGYPFSVNYATCPNCGLEQHRHTVRKRTKGSVVTRENKFFLTIIPEKDETLNVRKVEYKGDNIILNRNNTEPENHTITTKGQAELTFENGKWFISNKSALENTYIQIKGKFELHQGDVILLGDRRFKFEQE